MLSVTLHYQQKAELIIITTTCIKDILHSSAAVCNILNFFISKMSEEKEQSVENASNDASDDQNAWWKSWYSAAKSKSEVVLDFLKQDLNEISTTVKTEASSFINNTASAISDGIQINNPEWLTAKNTMKESVSSIINQVSKALNPPPLDGDEEPYIVAHDKLVSVSKLQKKLYLLSADPNTYMNEIEENFHSRYNAWLESVKNYEFNLLSNESLTKLLLRNLRLKENYEKLVPEQVSHGDFWNRYLFRKALLEDEEAEFQRKKNIEKRICDNLEWERESFGSNISLSEEEQKLLLREYENERNAIVKPESMGKTRKTNSEGTSESEVSSIQSVHDRESSSDDWEKDFDIEEIA